MTTTTPTPQPTHWRDRAITAAEMISDSFDVAKAYGAHIANWVLFFCLCANLIEMINSNFQEWAGMAIVGVQSISLDIAGFGLTAMAASAKRRGDEKSAQKANVMGWTLITVMAITVGLTTLNAFNSSWSNNIQLADHVLMFVRVIVTVFYGHIVHELRADSADHENRLEELQTEVGTLQKQIKAKEQEVESAQVQLSGMQKTVSNLQVELSNEREAARVEVESLQGKLGIKEQEIEMMGADQAGIVTLKRELNTAKLYAEDLQIQLENAARLQDLLDQEHAKVRSLSDNLQSAKLQNAGLQNDLQASKLQIAGLQTDLQNAQKMQFPGTAKISQRTAGPTSAKTSVPANVTQLDAAKSNRMTDAEIIAYMTANPSLKRSDVAERLGISERKVYNALAWRKEQENMEATS